MARNNGWKGYVPAVTAEGTQVVVRDDSEHDRLIELGYVRLGTYHGDPAEDYAGQRGYYQSSAPQRAPFRQGIAQSVHGSHMGVDIRYGVTRDGRTGGAVMGAEARAIRSQLRVQDGLAPSERLLPVFGEEGVVIGYELSLDPAKLTGVRRDENLGRMMGVWAGMALCFAPNYRLNLERPRRERSSGS